MTILCFVGYPMKMEYPHRENIKDVVMVEVGIIKNYKDYLQILEERRDSLI